MNAPGLRVCIVEASGKLGQYMVQHAPDRGSEVVGVCREQSVGKLGAFKGRITLIPGATAEGVDPAFAPIEWRVHPHDE